MYSLIQSLVPATQDPETFLTRRLAQLNADIHPYERMLHRGGLAGATAEAYLHLDREREDVSFALECLSEGMWV